MPPHRVRRLVRPAALVLAVALVAATGTAALWPDTSLVAGAAPGEQRVLRLPDGSTAHLNSGARLRYTAPAVPWPLGRGGRRVVLDGEAFFAVAHTGRPFVVETFNARVEVLGTRFNVRAHGTEQETEVTLASGRVRVSRRGAAAAGLVLARAGAAARVGTDDEPLPVGSSASTFDRAVAWRTQGFAVVDRPLGDVLAEVERRFAVEVTASGVDLVAPLNVFYPGGTTAEAVLRDVCLAQGCRFRPTSQGFAVEAE